MLITWYDKVVSRLPLFVEQNINAKAPLKFKRRLEVKILKDSSITVIPQLILFRDKHIKLRMTAMLSRRCSKKGWWLNIKSKRLALCRGKQDYSCARAFHFEYNRSVENIFFERYACLCQRLALNDLSSIHIVTSRAAPM